jgi:Transglycosylase SLT domain
MRKSFLYVMLAAAAVASLFAALSLPASAEERTVTVRLADGTLAQVQVDVPPGTPLEDIQIPTLPTTPTTPVPVPDIPGAPGTGGGGEDDGGGSEPEEDTPTAGDPSPEEGGEQRRSGSRKRAKKKADEELDEETGKVKREVERRKKRRKSTDLRNQDGSPTPQNPTYFDALPGPTQVTGVPNFVIRKFKVPIFLLPIYQSAGIQYGVRWEILAAINEIETDYGRNLNVSSAGALGWMQFIPSSWKMYGVDANKDGKKDPYNPVDAIFAAARYLKAAGYKDGDKDAVYKAIFAYNHADWYVDSVLLRARLIAGVPGDLVGSLTGLTEGRFPVYARAKYADDLSEKEAEKRFKKGENAARLVEEDEQRRGIEIYTRHGAPVVATNDGVIKKIGRSNRWGRYVVLQDVYGNRFTYYGLSRVSRYYPVPKEDGGDEKTKAVARHARESNDPQPSRAASDGRQREDDRPSSDAKAAKKSKAKASAKDAKAAGSGHEPASRASVPLKDRLFAHPSRPESKRAGGIDQILNSKDRLKGYTTFRNYFSRAFGLSSKDVRLKRLRKGSRVIGGTILGRVGRPTEGKASHLYFEIRPAGRGAPRIDPKPILDGWKLLEATAIYRASGRNALRGDDEDNFSIGQVLLLPKPMLERRVLSDERIELYPGGQQDVRSGQIDRRVLATLAVLAESGLRPTVTSLKSGHSVYTASGNVSHHSTGNAVDIAQINGVPILGHQEPGGITDQTVRRLLQMQGTLQADQIISLLEIGGPTIAMGDHADHIHVGFRPLFGENRRLGKEALRVLKPGQWHDLVERLGEIDNPIVPTKPSKYALDVKRDKHRSSEAHNGE